jgi:hypothetical protein
VSVCPAFKQRWNSIEWVQNADQESRAKPLVVRESAPSPTLVRHYNCPDLLAVCISSSFGYCNILMRVTYSRKAFRNKAPYSNVVERGLRLTPCRTTISQILPDQAVIGTTQITLVYVPVNDLQTRPLNFQMLSDLSHVRTFILFADSYVRIRTTSIR